MAEYIVNTDGEEARWSLLGVNYEEFFCERATRFMGNPVMERIVRCKDCVYCDDSDCFKPAAMFCLNGGLFYDDTDGFCSWGERR